MEALCCMKIEFLVCPERTVCFSRRFKTSTSVKPLRLLILSISSGDTFHEPLWALLLSRCVEFPIKKQVRLHVVSLSRQRLLIHGSACPYRSVCSEAAHMNVPQKNGGIKTGDEMTNANNIDTNVNAKSPKLTCCELLWLRVRNGKMERKKFHYL